MKILVLLLLLSAPSFAERITIHKQPDCPHMEIRGEDGRVVRVYTLNDMRDAIRPGDDIVTTQIKIYVRDSGLSTFTLIKTMLEAKDFVLD